VAKEGSVGTTEKSTCETPVNNASISTDAGMYPPKKISCHERLTGVTEAEAIWLCIGVLLCYCRKKMRKNLIQKEELKLNFYNNNSQNNIRNNGTSRQKLGGENFDCVLITTQLEIMSSLK
jgi:hypothetical protein